MADLLAQKATINLSELGYNNSDGKLKGINLCQNLIRLKMSLGHPFWVPIYLSSVVLYSTIDNNTVK